MQYNKLAIIATAFTVVIVLLLIVNLISDALYPSSEDLLVASKEEERGYVIETADNQSKEPEKVLSFEELLLAANVEDGKKVAKKCAACHNFNEGGAHKVGPALWDIMGSTSGSADGYNYSEAMKNANINWGYEEMYKYLEDPKGYVPGTKMAFAGLRKVEDRAEIIAYLRTLSNNPIALPELNSEPEVDSELEVNSEFSTDDSQNVVSEDASE